METKTDFLQQMEAIQNNTSRTENGAIGYRTTNSALLDLNFSVSSLRAASDEEIVNKFCSALQEDPKAAVAWLFFARDIRGGMGERRLFRICMKFLCEAYGAENSVGLPNLFKLFPEYGRWDDLLCLMGTAWEPHLYPLIGEQLVKDMKSLAENPTASVSLLAKWLPSNCSKNKERKEAANKIAKALHLTPRTYRKTLAALRQRIDIVERKMSAGEWGDVRYEAVPSKANLIYKDAFLRHDEQRRERYLGNLKDGKTKVNSSTAFPYEIIHKYEHHWEEDELLEGMWKALPTPKGMAEGENSTIVVADGSGSMEWGNLKNSKVEPLEIANALAIFFAERMTGIFKNRYITFSTRPQFVQFYENDSLFKKICEAKRHDECSNTNISAVFDLILRTALVNNVLPKDVPKNILIISDMEFDQGATSLPLFEEIGQRWKDFGYKLPRLVFWNVCGRTGTIPVTQNENGVALVSGFSPSIAKMVMGSELDPLKNLMDTLHSERYLPVWEAMRTENK